jgi:hypothetical protein
LARVWLAGITTVFKYQSEEGMAFASWTCMSWPQQVSLPSPALVQSASVPHFAQRYLLPNWLATLRPPENRVDYCFCSMGWPQQVMVPVPPLVIIISAPHLVQRYLLPT